MNLAIRPHDISVLYKKQSIDLSCRNFVGTIEVEGDAQYIITALEKDGEDLHVWKVTFLKKLSASHILSLWCDGDIAP